MASRVVKVQVCDRCGMEQRADVVAELPPGWARLVRQGGASRELCPTCAQVVMEFSSTAVTS